MSKQFKWALIALSQSAEAQIALFPVYAEPADELALNWEEAVEAINLEELQSHQKESISKLDNYILEHSGQDFEEFWTENALRNDIKWAKIRKLAKAAIESFEWNDLSLDSQSWAIYTSSDQEAE